MNSESLSFIHTIIYDFFNSVKIFTINIIMKRKEALTLGLKQYDTGKPCKYGHNATRFTTNQVCTECQSQSHKDWVKKNPDKQKALNDRHKHARRIQSLRSHHVRRHAQPKWADVNKIRKVYKEADQLTQMTGIPHQVHHRIPISENKHTVRGLHCEHNLIILTQEEHVWYHKKPERLRLLF